jgi:hypothetical protein
MDPAVTALQNVINRFAAVGGFPRVAVDGLWGADTKQGAYASLAWVATGKCYQSICPGAETSETATSVMAQWAQQGSSATSAKGLAEFLVGAAEETGLPHVAAPITGAGGGIPPISVVHNSYGAQTSLVTRFRLLPFWQQLALGALTALGLIWFSNRLKRAPKSKGGR